MESITANILRQPIIRSGVDIGLGLECGVKCGVEDCDLWNVRENATGAIDGFELESIVSRRDFGFGGDGGMDLRGDARGLAVFGAAVDDAMADDIYGSRDRVQRLLERSGFEVEMGCP